MLDEQNNPLTHAMYNQEEVKEAGVREKRPCRLEIPDSLERRIRDHLSQVCAFTVYLGKQRSYQGTIRIRAAFGINAVFIERNVNLSIHEQEQLRSG